MTALKPGSLDSFLRKHDPAIGALLIYGEDSESVRALAGKTVEHVAGSLDDPFCVAHLDEAILAGDPARLLDEVLALSLLGGPRVVWVRGADQNFLKSVTAILDGTLRGNFIVAETGTLAKTSALRTKFEASRHAAVLPVYDADDIGLGHIIEDFLRAGGLRIDEEAKARLIETAGRNGATLQRELEKLALYCQGAASIGADDVIAVCGEAGPSGINTLADTVFTGDVADADRQFILLVSSGVDPGGILSGLLGHIVRLLEIQQNVRRGTRLDQAMKYLKPPIFFKRQPAIQTQIGVLNAEALLSSSASLNAAIMAVRLNPGLGESLANRAVLAIARNARALRVGRA